jgi:hypothetical protein
MRVAGSVVTARNKVASGCREPASRRTDGAPIVRGMSRRIHLQKCGTRVPTRSGQINRLVVQWTGAAHRASSMGEIPFTTATGGMGDNASTVATQYGPVNSFRIRRDPGAVRARHFTGEVTAWAGPWPCSAEVPIGTRSPSSHRAAQSSSSPRSWAVQQATPPTYHAKRPTL